MIEGVTIPMIVIMFFGMIVGGMLAIVGMCILIIGGKIDA